MIKFAVRSLRYVYHYVLLNSIECKLAETLVMLNDIEHKLGSKRLSEAYRQSGTRIILDQEGVMHQIETCEQCTEFCDYAAYWSAGFCIRLDQPVPSDGGCAAWASLCK